MKQRIFALLVAICMCITAVPYIALESHAATTVTYTWPTASHIVDGHWGYEPDHLQPYHFGIDIRASYGAKVYAAADGTVIGAEHFGGYGECVRIKHANGQVTLYGHNSKLNTQKGRTVKRGDVIAYVGSSDAEVAHLHFGIYKNEDALYHEWGNTASAITYDPELLLKGDYNVWPYLGASNIASTGKIKLTWGKRSNAYKYKVYRKRASASTYSYLGSTTGTSYTNTSAVPSYSYRYKVKAYTSSDKYLGTSNTVLRSCDLAQPKLTGISSIASSGGIRVNFTGVKNANKYKIYRATKSTGTYNYLFSVTCSLNKGGEKLHFINNSGTPGKAYYYKIRAVNTNNSGADSALSKYMWRTRDLARPVVKVTRRSDGYLVLSWDKIAGAERYEIQRKVAGGSFTTTGIVTGTSCPNVKNMKHGTTYYYRVRAIDDQSSAATSAYSSVVSGTYK